MDLNPGAEEGKTYLYTESDQDDMWHINHICLDDYIGFS